MPRSLLLLALAAVTGLAWTVLGPGRDGAGGPDAAVLAEAELDAGPPDGTAHGGSAGADTASGAEPTVPGPTGPSEPSSPPWPSPGPTLYVHVTGEVARPGVVSVAGGARVVDAVEAAGGLTDGAATDAVNLAAPVTDGQQVLVPGTDAAAAPAVPGFPAAAGNPAAPPTGPAAPGTPPGGPPGGPPGPLDLNTATAAELESLPRVGPVLAGRIVEFRQQHGGFTAVTDLDAVPGIGPALMDALVPLVTV
ncbi:ComEA family DNA-binding protein [Kocuria sp. CPCC 205268]|uniref:helix-hairpin-helix domain-containing protein n=1 Tax=Kocuria oxytropis TaxID=3058913 RepID=UPI0034D590E1